MGRQVSYVNYPDDVEPLETFVRESTDVLFLRPRTATPEPVHAGSLLIPASETGASCSSGARQTCRDFAGITPLPRECGSSTRAPRQSSNTAPATGATGRQRRGPWRT